MLIISSCYFADDPLYYPEGHCWVRFQGDDVTVGTDSILCWVAGKVASVGFPQNREVQRNHVLVSVEGPRHFDVIRSPFNCKITSINEELVSNPSLINKDPYGKGWLVTVKVDPTESQTQLLQPIEKVRQTFERMIREMGIRCFKEFPDYDMYEIGTECSAVLSRLNDLLSSSAAGTVVHIVSDDPTAEIEIIRWSEQTGNSLVESRSEGNIKHFLVKKC